MRYLLDTNILAETRRLHGDANVKSWVMRQADADVAVSVITILEIDIGIRRLRRRDPVAAGGLQRWLDGRILPGFEGRILPVDLDCVWRIAPLHVPSPAPERDAIIAGTALAHGLTVVTRNTKDFLRFDVSLIDPWQ